MRPAGGSSENLQEPEGVLQLTWTFKSYSSHMRLAERKWEIDEKDTQKVHAETSRRETGAFTSQLDPEDTVMLWDFSFITKENYSNRACSINCWKKSMNIELESITQIPWFWKDWKSEISTFDYNLRDVTGTRFSFPLGLLLMDYHHLYAHLNSQKRSTLFATHEFIPNLVHLCPRMVICIIKAKI